MFNKLNKIYQTNKNKRFFFDFFTNWNIYLFIFCNFFYYESNLLLASRVGVIICSTIGSMILILRGKSACPDITKHIYTYGCDFDFSPRNILLIDIFAHGFPLYLVLNSKPIENFSHCPKTITLQYCIFSFCFIVFQRLRNISLDVTYNLTMFKTNTNRMILCIITYFITLIPLSINPTMIHEGWNYLYINQSVSSLILVLLYYYFLYISKEV